MSKKILPIEKLKSYSQKIIEDLFDMNDKDILIEMAEDNDNADDIIRSTKNIYEKVKSDFGKSRLTAARNQLNQVRSVSASHSTTVVNIENARRLLSNIQVSNNSLSQSITLAARNLDTLSDEEILSLYSDLMELGFSDDDNIK